MMNTGRLSLKKRIALSLYNIKKNTEAKIHDLTYLFWECTARCNLKCLHCGSDCTNNSDTPDMPQEDFLRVLRSIKQHVDPARIVIAVTGGEPLMRTDLEDAGKKIRSLGFRWGIVTNGYMMTKERFRGLMNSGISLMAISLDGLKEEHDWFRSKSGSFEKAVNTIELAAAASKKNLFFDVVTCVNQKNISHLQQLGNFLIDKGVSQWRLVSIFPKGRARDNEALRLSDGQFKELIDFIKDARRSGKINVMYGCDGFLGNYEMEVRDIPFFCRAGISIGSVLIDGSISACPSLRADYIQGNIYKDDFLNVWNSRFQIMRNREWAKTGECAECRVWKYCHGNGLHLRDQKSGELLYCHYNALVNGSQAGVPT